MVKEYNILISSVGGQGGVTLARILSGAALSQGLRVRVGETLGMAQRGGSVQSHIRIGEDVHGPLIPEMRSDVLLSLEPAEALTVARYIGKKTTMLLNTEPILPISVVLGEETYPSIDQVESILKNLGGSLYSFNALELAKKAGSSRSLNIIMLGAYMALGESILTLDSISKAMSASLPIRYLEQNSRALKIGMDEMKKLISKE